VLVFAQQEAQMGRLSYIGTEHVLLGLLRDNTGLAGAALSALGLRLDEVRQTVGRLRESEQDLPIRQMIPTAAVKEVIERAFHQAQSEKSSHVDTGHLLIGLLGEDPGIGMRVLQEHGLSVEGVGLEITRLRSSGMVEAGGVEPSQTLRLRHLDLVDEKGNPILVDIMFPPDYSLEQVNRVAQRIERAVRSGESVSKS
jgi:ATP-dependent Clp protease ATP-binding subunit ClpC